jgi:Serine/threonine protein kinase
MNSAVWNKIKDVFDAAAGLHDAECIAFLDKQPDEVRLEVLKLIAADRNAGDFIVEPAVVGLGIVNGDENPDLCGSGLDGYDLLREIGQGGMGTVYLASRHGDFEKKVALKLIKRGMDTNAVLKRFVMERQILAQLQHSNIAGLLDGGTTSDGLPYFVMEYIDGIPITKFCDEHGLSIEKRLELFRTVCSAVSYAHQNLVVHRDLKPSNILVTNDGVPKLLDFGIAKLLHPEWSLDTNEATATMFRIMTPEYASPEQIRGLPITTASDVYSLGVVLYELLSGERPYKIESRLPDEIAQIVLTDEPVKPSSVVSGQWKVVSKKTDEIAAQTDPKFQISNPKSLRGDVDNIVLKALRKEPERRYQSVQEFSDDIRRHLSGLPVTASADTIYYRISKFVKRHGAGVLAASLVLLSLLAGIMATTWQARRANLEREKAERRFKDVRNLANSFLFDFHDSIADLSGATKAREMVVRKAQEYLDSLANEAGEDRELLWELSTAYLKLGDAQGRPGFSRTGDTSAALQSYEKSLATRRRLADIEPDNSQYQLGLAETLSRFGPIFQVLGKPDAAVEKMREAMEITDKLLPQSQDWPTLLSATRSVNFLGDALAEMGNYDEALAMYQKSLSIVEQKRGVFSGKEIKDRLGVSRERLGIIYGIKGEWQKSLENHLEFLAITEELTLLEPTSLDYARAKATALDSVGDAYRGLGNYPKAIEYGKRGLAMYDDLLKSDPQNARAKKDVGDCSHHLAETLFASGDFGRALTLLQRTVAMRRELVALDATNIEYPNDLANSLVLTGESLAASRNYKTATDIFQEAREIDEPIVSAHNHRIDYRRGLAQLYTDLGDSFAGLGNRIEAETSYRKGLDMWRELQNQHVLWAKDVNFPNEVAEKLKTLERHL